MSEQKDLDGKAPDKCGAAMLIIDMINDLEFPDGEMLREPAEKAAERILALKKRCREHNIPIIYVNDNFGRWQSNFPKLVDHCLQDDVKGKKIATLLRPDDQDYFVLKPRHSAFYSTTLDILLSHLKTRNIIITGITTDICVYFTASDAYMRSLQITIPSDCVAAVKEEWSEMALENAGRILKADVLLSAELDLEKLKKMLP